MAIIRTDGFDHYSSAANMQTRTDILQYPVCSALISTPGRSGRGSYVSLNGNGTSLLAQISSPISKSTVGFGLLLEGNGIIITILINDQITLQTQCKWIFNVGNMTVSFVDASGTTVRTALNAFPSIGWIFVEIQNKIDNLTGTAAIRINGEPIAGFPDLTGLDTQLSSNASMSGVGFSGNTGGSGFSFGIDDFYIADDTTGPGSYPNNGFIGQTRCNTLFAIGNDSVRFTPLSGSNYQMVDDVVFDGDATYNFSATAGDQDSFNFQVLDADVNQIISLQVTIGVRKEDTGARTLAPVLVIGGVTYIGTAVAMDVSYVFITSLWPINPATSASWTAADVNAIAAGYAVVT